MEQIIRYFVVAVEERGTICSDSIWEFFDEIFQKWEKSIRILWLNISKIGANHKIFCSGGGGERHNLLMETTRPYIRIFWWNIPEIGKIYKNILMKIFQRLEQIIRYFVVAVEERDTIGSWPTGQIFQRRERL